MTQARTSASEEALNESVRVLDAVIPTTFEKPKIAVLLGSGWGLFAKRLTDKIQLPYNRLPAFPILGVEGHAGQVTIGRLGTTPLYVLAGRKHAYEEGNPAAMDGVIATLGRLGVQVLVQTNAAGSLKTSFPTGSVMLVSDHINNTGLSPLLGKATPQSFQNQKEAYDPRLRRQAKEAVGKRHELPRLHEGIYIWNLGPMFESPAEVNVLVSMKGSAVGMSTVPETILARHYGMRVLALSLMVNMAEGLARTGEADISHEQTLFSASLHGETAVEILSAVVEGLRP